MENILNTSISLKIASPEIIRSWSHGEVEKPETINYRTGRSERGGLFDERIFGPERDYECYCGKYKRVRYKGIICEKCSVEVTRSIVRRERMGHIDLASPVVHIWFLRGIPSRISLLLGIPVSHLEKVVYFAGYIIKQVYEDERVRILKELDTEYATRMKILKTDEDKEELKAKFSETKREIQGIHTHMVLSEVQYYRYSRRYSTMFDARIGAEALYEIFQEIDLDQMETDLEKQVHEGTETSRSKVEKRLALVRSLKRSETKPDWMFLTVLPVIPPALRPMVALEGGRHATSDVNDLYRRVINRNNRLKKLQVLGAPDVILRNEKRILQEAVDSLIDNSIRKSSGSVAMSQSQRRQLKSLADHLKGKQGIFRQNLLGKRVDYSGRSVIVVGPKLAIDQCGLPKYMALELFRPFVIAEIIKRELSYNIRGAGRMIEEADTEVWAILEDVIQDRYVLLNRAPTLHRLSIQAFKPVLIEGKAIQIHPLVCTAFNADFDGDQMAVHVPLSEEAQLEAKELIAANKNLLQPQTGNAITVPSQDIVLGVYWMTKEVSGLKGEGRIFSSPSEAIIASDHGLVDFRAKIFVQPTDEEKYAEFEGKAFETTTGRLLFNDIFPATFPYVNKELKNKNIKHIIDELIEDYGMEAAPRALDAIKNFGNKYVTLSGTTFAFSDIVVPENKKEIVARGHSAIDVVGKQYADGLISDRERYQKTIETWELVTHEIEDEVVKGLEKGGPIHDIIISGARGSVGQLNQSAGMKGVIQNAAGQLLEFPIISSYKEGHSPLEYFINTTTARKGLTDTALNTAKAGYLTRRLHAVSQDIVITEPDCKTKRSLVAKREMIDGMDRLIEFNLYGRTIAETLKDAEGTVIAKAGSIATRRVVGKIKEAGIESVEVRSPMMCESLHGVCQACYGLDLGRNATVKIGEAVGTIAAQAIGEPGTQLTLRTFHSGGVVGRDITQGLPRVDEIFEARGNLKSPAVIAQHEGTVLGITTEDKMKVISVLMTGKAGGDKDKKTEEYIIDQRRTILPEVKKGADIQKGQLLTDGSASVQELHEVGGRARAEHYIISEINRVYELHSAPVSPKHIEIIVRQMFSRRRIVTPGDSHYTTGEVVEYNDFRRTNEEIEAKGGILAKADVMVMGITDTTLSTKSWLSSAAFQHTTRTLIGNAVKGEVDELRGLNENVIIGNLIPAGTGFSEDFIPMKELYEKREQQRIELEALESEIAESLPMNPEA